MLIIPNPAVSSRVTSPKTLVINELYCPKGHTLLNPRATFDGYPGIFFQVSSSKHQGYVALSPVLGQNARIALELDLISGELMELSCPVCATPFPIYAPCSCGGNLVALFLTKESDFNNVIGICNRVDCRNFRLVQSGELITTAMLNQL